MVLELIFTVGLIFFKGTSFATADIKDGAGRSVGKVEVYSLSSGVLFSVELDGVEDGWHAFHIHEKGVCKPPDFRSAGGHWNPDRKKHGFLTKGGPHKGDLPNFYSKGGEAKFQIYIPWIKPDELIGKAIVIHKGEDDYVSQPSGKAGKRIACGVIRK